MSEESVISIFQNFRTILEEFKETGKSHIVFEYFKQKGYPNPTLFEIPNSKHKAIGFIKKKKIEGYAIVYYKNNDYFVGKYQNNKKNGYGYHFFPSGHVFKGEYENDSKLKGIVFNPNTKKIIYEGGFVNDLYHGKGMLYRPFEGTYRGSFKLGMFNGDGEIEFENGNIYKGDFVRGVREGKGEMVFASGDTYEGDFKKNKFHGYGTYTWANGSTFIGEFKNGDMIGEGKMRFNNLGINAEGSWQGRRNSKKIRFTLGLETNKELY